MNNIIDAIVLLMVVELWFYDDSNDNLIYNWCLWNYVSIMPANNLLKWMSHINYIDIDDVWYMYIQLLCNDGMGCILDALQWCSPHHDGLNEVGMKCLYIMNALNVTIIECYNIYEFDDDWVLF